MKQFGFLLLVSLYGSFAQQALAQTNRPASRGGKVDLDCVKPLIATGSSPNSVNNTKVRDWTAPRAAAYEGGVEITRVPLSAHALVSATHYCDDAAIEVARENGHTEVATLIDAGWEMGKVLAATSPSQSEDPRKETWIRDGGIDRMKLAVQEPRIKERMPDLQCVVEVSKTFREYIGVFPTSGDRTTVEGEQVTIKLQQGGHTIDESSWSTAFPHSMGHSSHPIVLTADVSGEALLIRLFHRDSFTQDDLADLGHSNIAEVRIGAATNLTKQGVLTVLATTDADPRVRSAAAMNLSDQAVLARVATGDKSSLARTAAVERLTDEAVLT
jgi:hypothetical protein